jgi:drug/metabolite transporter (DMT)-like permease
MTVWHANWPLILAHGAFISVSTCLLTLGPRYLASAEVALLILLESVLAPLLVWAVVGEDPGSWGIIGGAVVIGALFASNLWALRNNRRLRNRPQPRTGPPV